MEILKAENKIKRILLKKIYILYFIIITCVSLFMRLGVFHFISADYVACLHPWFETIKKLNGIHALQYQIGDYNIFYQFIIAIFTYLPIKDLYLYKSLSIIFDYLLAASTGYLVITIAETSKGEKIKIFLLTYSLILVLPTVFFDSAVWAQCDSIYTTFIVLSLAFLFNNKSILSFIMLGVAFSFKFQTIFILPFFILVWLINNRIYIYHFILTLVTFWLTGLPSYIFGRNIFSPFNIYLNQTNTYKFLFMNYFNFTGLFALKSSDPRFYSDFSSSLVMLTFLILVIGLMFLITNCDLSKNTLKLLGVSIWIFYTCVMFLPGIHERYAFPVDILILAFAILNKKYIIIALFEILNSFLSYTIFIFASGVNGVDFSYISVLTYFVFTFLLFYDCKHGFSNGQLLGRK